MSKVVELFDGTGPQEVEDVDVDNVKDTFMSAPGFTGTLKDYNEIRAEGRYLQAGGARKAGKTGKSRKAGKAGKSRKAGKAGKTGKTGKTGKAGKSRKAKKAKRTRSSARK